MRRKGLLFQDSFKQSCTLSMKDSNSWSLRHGTICSEVVLANKPKPGTGWTADMEAKQSQTSSFIHFIDLSFRKQFKQTH